MPKRKPSKGQVLIATPFEEIVPWLKQEVSNMDAWNPRLGHWYSQNQYQFADGDWILFYRKGIAVKSNKPVLHIRANLCINMGQGRIEIS